MVIKISKEDLHSKPILFLMCYPLKIHETDVLLNEVSWDMKSNLWCKKENHEQNFLKDIWNILKTFISF